MHIDWSRYCISASPRTNPKWALVRKVPRGALDWVWKSGQAQIHGMQRHPMRNPAACVDENFIHHAPTESIVADVGLPPHHPGHHNLCDPSHAVFQPV